MSTTLLGLLVINRDNLHTQEVNSEHTHADDHGPVITLGDLSFFQTEGPGEDLHPVAHDTTHQDLLGVGPPWIGPAGVIGRDGKVRWPRVDPWGHFAVCAWWPGRRSRRVCSCAR